MKRDSQVQSGTTSFLGYDFAEQLELTVFMCLWVFLDLATAFKRLIREKLSIEAVLKASTPIEDLSDVEALEAHLKNMSYKSEVRVMLGKPSTCSARYLLMLTPVLFSTRCPCKKLNA